MEKYLLIFYSIFLSSCYSGISDARIKAYAKQKSQMNITLSSKELMYKHGEERVYMYHYRLKCCANIAYISIYQNKNKKTLIDTLALSDRLLLYNFLNKKHKLNEYNDTTQLYYYMVKSPYCSWIPGDRYP